MRIESKNNNKNEVSIERNKYIYDTNPSRILKINYFS